MTSITTAKTDDHIRTLAAIVSSLCLVVLVPLNAWALSRLVDHGERLGVVEERMSQFIQAGPRYTSIDAQRDQGVVLRLLEAQGKVIEDHEGRLRIVERRNP